MKIVILPSVRDDLEAGFQFYEHQQEFLGGYFLDSLFADIGSLRLYAGITESFGNHRLLSKRLLMPFTTPKIRNDFRQSRSGLPPGPCLKRAKITGGGTSGVEE